MTTKRTGICNTPECRRMRELLSDFIDRALHWRTARTLEAHLAVCPPCRIYVASVETTIVLCRKRPVVDVPPAVRGHLREVLRERHEQAPQRRAGRCRAGAAVPGEAVARAAGKTAGKTTGKTTGKTEKRAAIRASARTAKKP